MPATDTQIPETTELPAASDQISPLSPQRVRALFEAGECVLVDVRQPEEHAREHIQGAALAPVADLDPDALPDGMLVFHCRSGARSQEAARKASARGRTGVGYLEGGILGWRQAGFPTVVNRRVPISIMRQVQITAGGMVAASTALGAFVNPLWLILAGFVGCGLVFAGVTGTCGLAAVLARMPWNRLPDNTTCPGGSCQR